MDLRDQILGLTKKYFKEAHQEKEFIPGETYIPVASQVFDSDDLTNLIDTSLSLKITTGNRTEEFEKRLPAFFGKKPQALFVNSGSSANLIAVSALGAPMLKKIGIRPLEIGDEVITAACGFPTTVNPIIQNGFVPVFVDIDPRTLNVTSEMIMSAKTKKTRAVVLAHTLGNPYRADIVSEWCKKEGLFLIEDCCDATGAKIGDSFAGSFGDYATVSFYPAHHMTTGEGGAVMSKDTRFRRIAESLRDWGRDCWCKPGKDNTCGNRFQCGYDHKYTYSNIGYNLKATELQGSLGLSQLDKLHLFINERRLNWKKIYYGIKSSSVLSQHLTPVEPTEGTSPSWFGFPIHCEEPISRDKLVQFLEDKKIGTRLVFGGNLTKQPAYLNVNKRIHGDLKNSDFVMKNTFWIGVHPALDSKKIQYVLEALEEAVTRQK